MLLLAAIVLLFKASDAAPLLDSFPLTNLNSITSSIVQQCNCTPERSMWDIVWSCLGTIFSCAWVSVHPNIPEPGESKLNMALRRLEFMFWAIVAPEMIILWAIRQWLGAEKLAKQYKRYKWTKTHGYFLQMGGFMLYKNQEPQGVISAIKLQELYDAGEIEFPQVTEKEIWDRSKADGLSKTIVLGQTTWFIAQCIARKVQHFGITELELVTVAFAFLNAFMYILWWNKPLNAQSHIPVFLLDKPLIKKETTSVESMEEEEITVAIVDKEKRPIIDRVMGIPQAVWNYTTWPVRKLAGWMRNFIKGRGVLWVPYAVLLHVPVRTVEHVISRLGDMARNRTNTSIPDGQMKVPTFYAMDVQESQYYYAVAVTSAIAIAFGGIHCAGWTFVFPSLAEAQLWRVSSVVITAIAFAALVLSLINIVQARSPLLRRRSSRIGIRSFGDLILYSLPFYVIARVILLVGAFIALRSLNTSMRSLVVWINFLPHI